MRRAWPLAALVLCACGEEWSPESLIEDLRVIGMRADPAELRPGESARLSALILDPSRPGQRNTVLWIGCDPDPFNLGRSACSDPAALQDPATLGSLGELPPGVRVIGFNDFAAYAADKELFRALAADDPRRISGTVGQVLAIAVAEETSPAASKEEIAALFARVQKKEVKSVVTLFRIRISEAPTRNTNPTISKFLVATEEQFSGARVQLLPAEKVVIEVQAPAASFEPYVQTSPTGMEDKIERITSTWYSTAGRFSFNRIALQSEVKAIYTGPGSEEFPRDLVPERRTGTFHVVLRDSRGGQTWTEQPFFICDPSLPAPEVTSIRAGAKRTDPISVEGKNLESLLDVVVEGVALSKGAVNASTGNWEALAPASLAPGGHLTRVHGKDCSRRDTLLGFILPP